MRKHRWLSFTIIMLIMGSCSSPSPQESNIESNISEYAYPVSSTSPPESDETFPSKPPIDTPLPTPTPMPDPFSELYGCEMELEFMSGPLESRKTRFAVLGKDYFYNKGDQFFPGRGTSIYYEKQHYFVLHSSYVNGDPLNPLEAEFIRLYIEHWGDAKRDYIQNQIESLVGSEIVWKCSGHETFRTRISGIIRLSHEASDQLWMEPRKLEQIVVDRKGLISEWVGGFDDTNKPVIYIGFCGWGKSSLGEARFTYYRYIIQFEVIQAFSRE
jgi:hypothetical protein